MMNESALLELLEAIYDLETDNETWLAEILGAMTSLCGEEHSYLGFFYDASDVEAFNVWNVCRVALPPEVDASFRSAQLTVGAELLQKTLMRRHIGSIRELCMPHVAELLAQRERVGWGDLYWVNGLDPSGIGCTLTIGTREREFRPTEAEREIYSRIAQHVATAFRCRRRLGLLNAPHTANHEAEPDGAAAEAILDADGHVVHAEGEAASKTARKRIRGAARSLASVRLSDGQSATATLDAWRPLVGARWTLVDSFEENGRQYVVARENQARAAGLDMLTERERQVVLQAELGFTNKEIAYALGLSDSTVRVLVARAAGRIGVRTRAELLSHLSLRKAATESSPKPEQS